jgi:hypothetical protein
MTAHFVRRDDLMKKLVRPSSLVLRLLEVYQTDHLLEDHEGVVYADVAV